MQSWLSKILSPVTGRSRQHARLDIARMPLDEAWRSDFQLEDQFVVSFPRSGNTWLRHLLWELIVQGRPEVPSPDDLLALLPTAHHRVPVELQHRAFGLRGRIFKSHNIADLAGQRMIYLLREPADTLVSFYHFRLRRAAMDTTIPAPGSLDAFCEDLLEEWCEHVELAIAQRRASPAKMHFADYASLQRNTVETLRHIADFLGLGANEALLGKAVERCSFEHLRARERSSEKAVADRPFFRKGRAGSGTEELRPATLERIQCTGAYLYRQAAEIAATAASAR